MGDQNLAASQRGAALRGIEIVRRLGMDPAAQAGRTQIVSELAVHRLRALGEIGDLGEKRAGQAQRECGQQADGLEGCLHGVGLNGKELLQQALHALAGRVADQKVTLRIGEPVMTVPGAGREFRRPGKIGGLDE